MRLPAALAGALLLGTCAGCADERVVAGPAVRVVPQDKLDHTYGHDTTEDWVTYADHVVVATVVAERPGRDDGSGHVPRTVTLRVDDLLWSYPEGPRPPAAELEVAAWGWAVDRRTGARHPEAVARSPRLEPGHRYVLAVRFEPGRCSEGDLPVPARWVTLGPGAAVPYDDGVLGRGEVAGEVRTEPADGPTLEELRTELASIEPGPRAHLGRGPSSCG